MHAGTTDTTGVVSVPKPASCDQQAPQGLSSTSSQPATSGADSGGTTLTPQGKMVPLLIVPTPKPTPTRTPTPTPTPKAAPKASGGSLVPLLSTPTPTLKAGQ